MGNSAPAAKQEEEEPSSWVLGQVLLTWTASSHQQVQGQHPCLLGCSAYGSLFKVWARNVTLGGVFSFSCTLRKTGEEAPLYRKGNRGRHTVIFPGQSCLTNFAKMATF